MNVLPYSEITTTSYAGRQRNTSTASAGFQKHFSAQWRKAQIQKHIQTKRNEMLNRFQGLTEEKLNRLAQDHDVENMSSNELFRLAGSLMTDGVLPYYSPASGLNKVAVYPMSLYRSYLNGEGYMTPGVVQREDSDYYFINPLTDSIYFNYPRYGIRSMEYDYRMMQKAFETYNSYYTDEERSKQLQLADSKADFLDFLKLLASYREDLSK